MLLSTTDFLEAKPDKNKVFATPVVSEAYTIACASLSGSHRLSEGKSTTGITDRIKMTAAQITLNQNQPLCLRCVDGIRQKS